MPSPVSRVLQEGHIVHLANHTVLCTRDGREVVITDSGAPIRSAHGDLLGVVMVFQDVSAQQRMETEIFRARKIESVGVLAGGIAHDFNNLLTGILGNISFAKMLAREEVIVRRLAEAEKACERATALTYQLLTFAKGGPRSVRLFLLWNSCMSRLALRCTGPMYALSSTSPRTSGPSTLMKGKSTRCSTCGAQRRPCHARGGNDSRARGECRAWGRRGAAPARGALYHCGRAGYRGAFPDLLPNVFDPYVTTKEQGSGLGLATAYAVMRKHDGHMTVESQEGVGTTVRIYQPASSQALAPTAAPCPPPLVGSGRILVMDDEEMICELLQALLASLGYGVVCVRDGTEALAVYQQAQATGQGFAAVILDHTIPGGVGGVDTMTRLRAVDPHVKALISSGYANGPVMARWAEYGFRGVIPKPYTIERLQEALVRLFQEW